MKFILSVVAVLIAVFAVGLAAKPADVKPPAGAPPAKGAKGAVPAGNSTAPALLKAPLQCLYDFHGKRVNTDCNVAKPVKCVKGSLVQTMNGEKYEMCCCNYSKFFEEDGAAKKK